MNKTALTLSIMENNKRLYDKSSVRPRRDKEYKKVSRDFEAIFIKKIFETMRKTVTKSGLIGGGIGEEIFTSIYDNEISKLSSVNGEFGISKIIYNSLKKNDHGQAHTAAIKQRGINK